MKSYGVAGIDRRRSVSSDPVQSRGRRRVNGVFDSIHAVIAVFHVTSKTFELLERYPGIMPCPTFFVINSWVEA